MRFTKLLISLSLLVGASYIGAMEREKHPAFGCNVPLKMSDLAAHLLKQQQELCCGKSSGSPELASLPQGSAQGNTALCGQAIPIAQGFAHCSHLAFLMIQAVMASLSPVKKDPLTFAAKKALKYGDKSDLILLEWDAQQKNKMLD